MKIHELNESIVKKGGNYVVKAKSGRSMGTYDTKKEAEKRLRQVEMFKHMGEELEQLNPESPMDSQVIVQGIGRYSVETLGQSIKRQLSMLVDQADRGNWENIKHTLDPNSIGGTLLPKVEALLKALDDLESERKKGGARSRNIELR